MPFYIIVLILSIFISYGSAEKLEILTTYQAEDVGIDTESHPQCTAWRLWWKTEETNLDLSSEDIDMLAYRRKKIIISIDDEVDKYNLPQDILQNYTSILIDFREVCRGHPRVLRIASSRAAQQYGMNIPRLCNRTEEEDDEIELLPSRERREAEEQLENKELEKVIRLNSTEEITGVVEGLSSDLLRKHQSISINISSICNGDSTEEEDPDLQYYREKHGHFLMDVKTLNESIEQIMASMRNTDRLDTILSEMKKMSNVDERPFPSTQILAWLKKVNYDSRSPPVLFEDDQVIVKTGIHIQSMSNFELSTMDYDVDAWLRMAWLDPRLAHGYSRPILINEYTFLKKIWRPDPIFTNCKAAAFHKVSNLNFYMVLFPGGEVFLDMRVHLKPTAAKIVLCKYPHDTPACSLKISSLGFTQDLVRLEWFSRERDAILLNQDVQIPELMIQKYYPDRCDGVRKSGNYSCLEAHFLMKREIGFHIAQTYIPTTICVIFSMISVWLPEEFVEGRIFVSLTVFLTLSAENNSAKEELPKVSYIKAIDIWFGFTSSFVFLTMLQALIVISLEHNSTKLRSQCEKHVTEYSQYQIAGMMLRSRYLHKLARKIDTFCKVMYPVIFILFLMIYGFVITQGDEKKCLQSEMSL